MAKPFAEDVGNGMHIHFSLIDSSGNNVFDNGTPEGSELCTRRWRAAWKIWLTQWRFLRPILIPTDVLVPGCYAPTAPTWGYENRTTALRIPAGKVMLCVLNTGLRGRCQCLFNRGGHLGRGAPWY